MIGTTTLRACALFCLVMTARGDPLLDAAHAGDPAAAARALAAGARPDARDADGNTALHWAAINGDAKLVRRLLAAGAVVDALNGSKATPLVYATANVDAVRALLDAGAKVNHATAAGTTPLIAAARRPQSAAVVRLLLARGADWKPATFGDPTDGTALDFAAVAGDRESVRLLLAAGARPANVIGPAAHGRLDVVDLLLDAGAPVNFADGFAGHALNYAFYSQQPAIARRLVERGADLNLRAPRGEHHTPPILWSAYNQTGDVSAARALLARGADVNLPSAAGDTALDWARLRANRPLEAFLLSSGARPGRAAAKAKPTPDRALPADDRALGPLVRAAAARAIPLLQHSSDVFLQSGVVAKQACVSCHHQTLPAVAYQWAQERGLPVDRVSLARQTQDQVRYWRAEDRVRKSYELVLPQPDAPLVVGYGIQGLAALGYPADDLTEAMTWYLMSQQQPDGSWPTYDYRPPMEDGPIPATAFAVRVLQSYPLPGRPAATEQAVARGRRWLESAKPATFNQRVFQLQGLGWAGAKPARLRSLVQAVLRLQQPDGGWAQLDGLPADAWATGQALVALHTAGGVATTHAAYRRGVRFLLRTQFDDGSWYVRSRAWPFQPHFDSAFPHGKDQWISAGATTWALMALLLTEPATVPVPKVDWLAVSVPRPPAPAAAAATAPAVPATATVDFVRDVRPILERSCHDCHGGENKKGDFSLATRDGLLRGGQSGEPVVIPGNGAASRLIAMVADEIEDLEMPPLHKRGDHPPLEPADIALLRKWIDEGLAWEAEPAAR